MFEGCKDAKSVTEEILGRFLDKEVEESSTAVTFGDLSKMVRTYVRMKMSVKSTRGRMKLLFMEYRSFLQLNALKWVVTKNPKVPIKQVLSFIKPVTLNNRLEQDFSFHKSDLRSGFDGFMKHALDISAAFEMIDNGPYERSFVPQGQRKDQTGQNFSHHWWKF